MKKGGHMVAKRNSSRPGGVTLIELMVMSVIASLVALTVIQGFSGISRGIIATRFKSIATQMASQRMQTLKSNSYYRLRVSSLSIVPAELDALSPPVRSDVVNYFPTESVVNGVHFTNYTIVERVQKNGSSEDLEAVSWNSPDTGLKQITLDVVWRENGSLKRIRLSNLLENPNRSTATGDFVGTVRDANTFALLSDVTVRVSQNASLNSLSDGAGVYKIGAPGGTYTLQALKQGYFTKTSGNAVMASSTPLVTVNFDLTAMSSGTISGSVWHNDHLVISRVCGSKMDGGVSQEYVEIFNPTTWTWTGDGAIGLTFQRQLAQDPLPLPIAINYAPGGANIVPGGFYLFANVALLNINGTLVTADAVWENTVGGPNDMTFPAFNAAGGKYNILLVNGVNPDEDGASEGAGVLTLTGLTADRVGWQGGGSGNPAANEGTPIPGDFGLKDNKILFRKSDVGGAFSSTLGPAYDSGNNSVDWGVDMTGGNTPPRSTASPALPVRSGIPSNGAFVFADDGLSQMTQASLAGSPPEARFTLPAIATGTWNVSASTGSFFLSYSTTVTAGVTLSTSVVLNTPTTYGFVSGQVLNGATSVGIAGISVSPGGGLTNAGGYFNIALLPGDQAITGNPNGTNPNFTEASLTVPVTLGQISSNNILSLSGAGKIRGRITVDGVTPLPDVPVAVTNNSTGYTADNAVSASDGYFILSVPNGIYTVQPTTAFGETTTPLTTNVNANVAGATVFAATYTVTSAYGMLAGHVSSAGTPINTGVLVIASTSAVPGTLLDINNAFRGSGVLYYSGQSSSDGTYAFDLKNGTYTVSGWYTTFNGNTPVVTRIDQPGVVVLPRQTTSLDLAW